MFCAWLFVPRCVPFDLCVPIKLHVRRVLNMDGLARDAFTRERSACVQRVVGHLDLFPAMKRSSIKLHVRRAYLMDACDELFT